jgi:ribosomal protein L37E
MTREKAINHIRYGIIEGNYPLPKELGIEACEMAIEALEQQPCDDCISRQAVLDMLEDINAETEGVGFYYEHYVEYIKNLPPVTPQPKIGRWINIDATHSKCDRCGAVFEIASENGESNYCPNCGAKMESEDKE